MKNAMMVALLVLLGAGWAGANLVQNGNFDSSAANWTLINTSGGGGGSYVSTGGNPGGFLEVSCWDGITSADGTRYWVQGLAVTPGTTYNLTFDYVAGGSYSRERVDYWQGPGYATGWIGWVSTPLGGVDNWTTKTASFTTPSNCNYIQIKFEQNSAWSSLCVDNVNLVPEPATVSLILLGLAGLLRRR